MKRVRWNNIPRLSRYTPDGRLHIYKLDHCHTKCLQHCLRVYYGLACTAIRKLAYALTAGRRLKTSNEKIVNPVNEFRGIKSFCFPRNFSQSCIAFLH